MSIYTKGKFSKLQKQFIKETTREEYYEEYDEEINGYLLT